MEQDEENSQELFSSQDDHYFTIFQTPHKTAVSESPSYSPTILQLVIEMESNNSTIEELIQNLDSNKTLSIWDLLKDIDEDPLVKEYTDLIRKVNHKPEIPNKEALQNLNVPNFELPTNVQVNVLNYFTTYFQCRYSALNISNAVNHDVCLFSPFIHFKIPNYQLLPKAYFDESKETKTNFALAVQSQAANGLAFIIELLLLRIRNEILTIVEAKTTSNDPEQQKNDVDYFYLSFYKAAQENFHNKFTVKNITWDEKPSKVKDTLPNWRKTKAPPPPVRPNRFANDLIKNLEAGKIKISHLGSLNNNNGGNIQGALNTKTPANQQESAVVQIVPNQPTPENNNNGRVMLHTSNSTSRKPAKSAVKEDRQTVKFITKSKPVQTFRDRRLNHFNGRRNFKDDQNSPSSSSNSTSHLQNTNKSPILID